MRAHARSHANNWQTSTHIDEMRAPAPVPLKISGIENPPHRAPWPGLAGRRRMCVANTRSRSFSNSMRARARALQKLAGDWRGESTQSMAGAGQYIVVRALRQRCSDIDRSMWRTTPPVRCIAELSHIFATEMGPKGWGWGWGAVVKPHMLFYFRSLRRRRTIW